jgi:hypothetical protein
VFSLCRVWRYAAKIQDIDAYELRSVDSGRAASWHVALMAQNRSWKIGEPTALSFNKLAVQPLNLEVKAADAQDGSSMPLLCALHGDEEKKGRLPHADGGLDMQQGSDEAAPGSASTSVLLWSTSCMVEGRQLPPSSSTSVHILVR